MLLYFTSNGQSCGNGLSELGKVQAGLLAEHLKTLEFQGVVISAPQGPCLQTAEILARSMGKEVTLWEPFGGCGKAEMPGRVSPELARAYRELIEQYPNSEMLLVVEAEVCRQLVVLFEMEPKCNSHQYNCALSSLDPVRWKTKPVVLDTSFIPYQQTTLENKTREEIDLAYMASSYEKEIKLPDLSTFTGELVLHISDTESNTYPFYRKLIELVKPKVIIHTGDFADEVKIGRHPEYRYEYTLKAKAIIEIMRASGARMIFAVGNHDVYEVLQELAPDAEIHPVTGETVISGIPCRVGHRPIDMIFDRQYCLYGHGPAKDPWRYGLNIPKEYCRFNASYGSYFYDLKKDLFARIPRFYC